MENRQRELFFRMAEFDPDPGRIQHLTKVHAYARLIGQAEGLDPDLQETVETAAIVHDIAIRRCLEKYHSAEGPLQEQEGPALAREMLAAVGYDEARIDRVCWLVAHHHTYHIKTMDHQILVEADFLVNAYEGRHSDEANRTTLERIFKTPTGKRLFRTMYGLE